MPPWEEIKANWKSIALILGAIVSIASPLLVDWLTFYERLVYALSIALIFTFGALVVSWRRLLKLDDKIEEQEEYSDLIDAKYTLPVQIRKKYLTVEINEDGDDTIKYTNELFATENHTIDEFYALIGTDKEVQWSDLSLDTENASVTDHYRRDFEDLTRFIVTLELHELVSSDPTNPYEVSYSFEHDVVDVNKDFAYLIIRHPTNEVKVELTFPEGWEPVRYIAKPDEEDEAVELPQPNKEENDDGLWKIEWDYNSCSLGERYKIDWLAERTEAATEEVEERGMLETEEGGEVPRPS